MEINEFEWLFAGAVLMGALKPVLEMLIKFIKTLFRGHDWIRGQDTQAELLEELRAQTEQRFAEVNETHKKAIRDIKEEQTIIIYGNLACLKGLEEQGCDGPVHEAIEKLEKYLNRKAHE